MEIEELHIQKADKTFLTKLYNEGGEVGTNQFTQETSLSKNQVHRRFRKFREAGVIKTETRNPRGKHWDRETFATLTEDARSQIQQGALGNIFTPDEPDDDLEERVEELEEQIEYLGKFLREAELRIKAQRLAIDDSEVNVDVDTYIKKIRENSE